MSKGKPPPDKAELEATLEQAEREGVPVIRLPNKEEDLPAYFQSKKLEDLLFEGLCITTTDLNKVDPKVVGMIAAAKEAVDAEVSRRAALLGIEAVLDSLDAAFERFHGRRIDPETKRAVREVITALNEGGKKPPPGGSIH